MCVERHKRSIGLLSRLGRFPACSCDSLGIKLGLREARVAVDGAVKKRRLRRSHVCSRSAMRLNLRDSKLLVVLCASCWNEDNMIWGPGNGRLFNHARLASRYNEIVCYPRNWGAEGGVLLRTMVSHIPKVPTYVSDETCVHGAGRVGIAT